MQISGSFVRPINQLPVDQQAARERSALDHGSAVLATAGSAESNLTLRAVGAAREVEALLFRTRGPSSPSQQAVDPRSQRALSAYAALEQHAEQEYVSTVLGIDEYV
ncbi:MAG: hypothetical protein QNJ78_15855 [Gammaproteobacteria bacterium]|nr:hypothetical protein [Gammaproteobacteria bacterium]